jgi:heme/copper-type cytochrome/quinol oxidase subunit 3
VAPETDTGAERTRVTDMPEGLAERDSHGGHASTTGISNNKLSMWLFLGSECLLFGGLISTYMLYRGRHSGNLGPTRSTTSRSRRCRASCC